MTNGTMLLQFVKFALVGIFNTGIHYGIFLVLFHLLGIHYLISSAVGYCCGLVNSFIWNKLWTFQTTSSLNSTELIRFGLVNIASLLVNLGSLKCFVAYASMSPEFAQFLAIGLSMTVNFLSNYYWTFGMTDQLAGKQIWKTPA